MGIEKFTQDVVNHEGFILSDGTLNLEHLLPKVYDLITTYELNSEKAQKLKKDILDVFIIHSESFKSFEGEQSLFVEQYWGDAELNEEKMDDANWIWNEDAFDFLCGISPDGYYYGSAEGDGACLGWFKEHICSNCGSEFNDNLNDGLLCDECFHGGEEDEEN